MEAFKGSWNKVNFILCGLPTETDDEYKGNTRLCEKNSKEYFNTKRSRIEQVSVLPKFVILYLFALHLSSGKDGNKDEYPGERAHLVKDTMKNSSIKEV